MQNELLSTATHNFFNTANRLNLRDRIVDSLFSPKERIECCTNPILSSGHHRHIKTFIVRHNDVLGPSKGGIRMMEQVSLDDITGLAMEMTWKTALIGVPFGGGKAGICCDGSRLSADDKEIVLRSFTRGMARQMGPEVYIPAPDMGTNEKDMGHIKDCIAYSAGVSITRGCFVTGKPVILGGIIGRKEATGNGVVYSTQAACKRLAIEVKGAKVVIQGFGNVGSVAALGFEKLGAKIIAVADVSGALYHEQGIDCLELTEYVKHAGSISGYPNAQRISAKDLFELECDILVPAAAQSQITQENAARVQAKIIAEGANAPTTPEADEILNDKGVFIIPDILCNAGGVFVSYLEYTQETQREQMTLEQVDQRLTKRMMDKFQQVYEYAGQQKVSMRNAAMDIAVKAITEGLLSRGFHP